MSGNQSSVSLTALAPVNVNKLNALQDDLLGSLSKVSFRDVMSDQTAGAGHSERRQARDNQGAGGRPETQNKQGADSRGKSDRSAQGSADKSFPSKDVRESKQSAEPSPAEKLEQEQVASKDKAADVDGEAQQSALDESVEPNATEESESALANSEDSTVDPALSEADQTTETLTQAANSAGTVGEFETVGGDLTVPAGEIDASAGDAAGLDPTGVADEVAGQIDAGVSMTSVAEFTEDAAETVTVNPSSSTGDRGPAAVAGRNPQSAIATQFGGTQIPPMTKPISPPGQAVAEMVKAEFNPVAASQASLSEAVEHASAMAAKGAGGVAESTLANSLSLSGGATVNLSTANGLALQLSGAGDSGVDGQALKEAVASATAAMGANRQLQPGLSQYQSAEGRLQTYMQTAMGQPQWGSAVGERVLWLASQNIKEADIRLDPPELGQLQVRVSVNQDQASVTFTSPHANVREALDQNAFRLREMFQGEGMDLVNVDISDQSHPQYSRGESDERGGNPLDAVEEDQSAGITQPLGSGLVDQYV